MGGISPFCCASAVAGRTKRKQPSVEVQAEAGAKHSLILCSCSFFFITCSVKMKSDGEAARLLTCCHDDSFYNGSRRLPPPLWPRPCQSAPGLRLIGRWRQTGRQTSRRADAQEFSYREATSDATPALSGGGGERGGAETPPILSQLGALRSSALSHLERMRQI